MKRNIFSALALGLAFGLQAQDLPQPSPMASLDQRVGLTDIHIEYSRPSAKEREIFGGLVPYGKLWRTGANKATLISFNTPINLVGEMVPAGEYALFTIPSEGEWTVILNSETEQWGTGNYSSDNDVLRVNAEVVPAGAYTETFTIEVQDLRENSAVLVLRWAGSAVQIPFEVETEELAMSNIKTALAEATENPWRVYRNAANYYHNAGLGDEQALEYIDMSLKEKQDSWYSYFLKAEILAALDRYEAAVQSAERSLKVGMQQAKKNEEEFTYAAMLRENIGKWQAMAE